MLIKGITVEDFVNYKLPSMYIAFPYCTFKCEKECGMKCCQNSKLAQLQNIDITVDKLLDYYFDNPITHAVVCGGLEPLDSWDDLLNLVKTFRSKTNDDIVIYTGYTEDEVSDKVQILQQYPKILIKFGRFRPNDTARFDEVLGITLASKNQYGKKIS